MHDQGLGLLLSGRSHKHEVLGSVLSTAETNNNKWPQFFENKFISLPPASPVAASELGVGGDEHQVKKTEQDLADAQWHVLPQVLT